MQGTHNKISEIKYDCMWATDKIISLKWFYNMK